jgi:1,4-dihydroxy-6-naphthoate synthase
MPDTITLAHSPDSDDAFMFYGLATNKLDTGDLSFEHLLKDIQTLNEEAMRGTYDITAISFHAYAYIHDKYALLPHGASIGDNYGPIVVSREPAKPDDIQTHLKREGRHDDTHLVGPRKEGVLALFCGDF